MAMTMEQLKQLAEQAELRYFLDPRRDALMFGARGMNGSYQVELLLEVEGTFLQFRSIDNRHCPAEHPHLLEVLKVIAGINYRARFVKIGWDANDGEIVVYGDMWISDGTVVSGQFQQMLQNYFSALDMAHARIRQTLETGKDPGEESPESVMKRLMEQMGGSLPPALKELLDHMEDAPRGGGGDGPKLKEI